MIHAFFLFTLTRIKWHLFGNISDRGYVLMILGYESRSAPWVRFNTWRIHFPCTYQTPFFGESQLCIIHLHSFPYVIKRRASNRACWRRAPHVAGKGLFHLLEMHNGAAAPLAGSNRSGSGINFFVLPMKVASEETQRLHESYSTMLKQLLEQVL